MGQTRSAALSIFRRLRLSRVCTDRSQELPADLVSGDFAGMFRMRRVTGKLDSISVFRGRFTPKASTATTTHETLIFKAVWISSRRQRQVFRAGYSSPTLSSG